MIRRNIIPTYLLVTAYMIVVIGVALGVAACGQDEGPFSPSGPDPVLNEATVTINGVELLKSPGGLRLSASKTKEIGDDGGTIGLDGALLRIPGGALNDDKHISMADGSGLWEYDFGPDGLQFKKSATLKIEITQAELQELGIDADDLAVAYASGTSSNWEILGGKYDPVKEEISLPVDHFSRYALCIE